MELMFHIHLFNINYSIKFRFLKNQYCFFKWSDDFSDIFILNQDHSSLFMILYIILYLILQKYQFLFKKNLLSILQTSFSYLTLFYRSSLLLSLQTSSNCWPQQQPGYHIHSSTFIIVTLVLAATFFNMSFITLKAVCGLTRYHIGTLLFLPSTNFHFHND